MYIRKVAIGPDYKSGAMHYVHGNTIQKGSPYVIHAIQRLTNGNIKIWISKGEEVVLWKEFNSNMPYSIEYNISFN